MIKNFFKKFLYPLRKLATQFILKDDLFPSPINLAATYIHFEDVEGDYLEFGCFKGYSFIKAYNCITSAPKKYSSFEKPTIVYNHNKILKKNEKNLRKRERKFFAFDSFQGLPKLQEQDKDHPLFFEGRYYCSEKDFLKILSNSKVRLEDVTIVPGYYEKTLDEKLKKNIELKKAAIVMIDCDLYSSTKIVLNFITNLIDNGTIIIFDDWFTYKARSDMGEQKACKEWLAKNKGIKLIPYARYSYTQMSFIVNKI